MAGVTERVFGSKSGVHFHVGDDQFEATEGGLSVKADDTFVVFEGDPISDGVFRCAVKFGTGGDEDQHIGVIPAASMPAALGSSAPVGFAYEDCKGWGIRSANGEVVTAGSPAVNARSWTFTGKTVEMILDATACKVEIRTAGETPVCFENVQFPVYPAIYLYESDARLISSSHETVESKMKVMEEEVHGQVTGFEALMRQMSEKVSALEGRIAEQNEKIVTLENHVASRSDKSVVLQQEIAIQAEKILALEGQAEKQREESSALQQHVASQDEKMITLENQIAIQNDSIQSLQARLFKHSAQEPAAKPESQRGRSFATSEFKRLYEAQQAVTFQHELFGALSGILRGYAALVGDTQDHADQLFTVLQAQAFNAPMWASLTGRDDKELAKFAVVIWTSISVDGLLKPFCSILNHVIREGEGDLLKHAVVICRTMACHLVTRNRGQANTALTWPPDLVSHRATFMPRSAVNFFTVGNFYRAPMFLATSFSEETCFDFLRVENVAADRVAVHFKFVLHKILKCDHALYIEGLSQAPHEKELLYVPYSAFKVLSIIVPTGNITWDNPVVIELEVQPNNASAPEDLPLSEWH